MLADCCENISGPLEWPGSDVRGSPPAPPCTAPASPSTCLSSAFYFYLFSQGGTVTMMTNHLGLYKAWVPRREVAGPQGHVEGLRQEPLVSRQGYSSQEWGLKAAPSA